MSWGPGFMYYHCSQCGKKFKYELGLIAVMGDSFGKCPDCGKPGIYESDGACTANDMDYEYVDEEG